MIATHICEECAPAVALESARQELGSGASVFKLCQLCTEGLERLYHPLVLPWFYHETSSTPENPFGHLSFEVVETENIFGRAPKYFVRADLSPLC